MLPIRNESIDSHLGKASLRIDEPLGMGAFGVVFKAIDVSDRKSYAVKFPQSVFPNGKELQSFQNEILAAQEITHSNVVKVLFVNIGSDNEPPYLVMEFMEDGTLKSHLEKISASGKFIDLATLQKWSLNLVDGLAAINERMLHRDLKPDNIMLSNSSLKISDFGLAKIVGAATRSKSFKGGQHIYYMAPEGWKQETNNIQIDMYSLGIVLFEIAALEFPYILPKDARNFGDFEKMHLFQPPKLLQDIRNDLPLSFCHIIARLLEKRPEDRFQNWQEVKNSLQRIDWNSEQKFTSDPLITSLVEAIGERHTVVTHNKLEAEQHLREKQEQEDLDRYQMNKLIETISEMVSDFNTNSTLGQIEEKRSRGLGRVYYLIPHGGGEIELNFFEVNPPLNLRRGVVRFAACANATDGTGFNLLLCRQDKKDLYGKWVVCKVQMVAGLRPHLYDRQAPFGFNSAEEAHEIEASDRAMHIYETEFSEDIRNALFERFLHLIKNTH